MIRSKTSRCQIWVWAFISRYSPVRPDDIPAGGTYSREEVDAALARLVAEGVVECEDGVYHTLVPLVVVI